MPTIQLETRDTLGTQYVITDWLEPTWSTIYGEDGSGFAFFRFSLPRKIGYNYPDIGYGHEFICRKYLQTILFHGTIREIEDEAGEDGERISVSAFGEIVAADDDELLRAYCDTRLSLWSPPSEIPKGNFHPDYYSTGSNALGLFLHPNNGTEIEAGHYTDLEYEFYPGETAERFKATLSMMMGMGALFDAEIDEVPFTAKIDTVDDGTDTITYKEDSGENTVKATDTITNTTRSAEAVVSSITPGTNTIVFSGAPDLSTWAADDNIEVNEGRIKYINESGLDTALEADMVLWNFTQDKQVTIYAVDAANDLIQAEEKSYFSGWEAGDDIFVSGPAFYGVVSDVTGAVVTYETATEIGEGNIATSWPISNISKKSIAEVQSNDTGADTITVTDAGDVESWEEGDVIVQGVSLFYATVANTNYGTGGDGDGTGTLEWTASSDLGTRIVSVTTGWVLYNQTRDSYATVDGWNVASRYIGVDDYTDMNGWTNGDIIRIYTPVRISIHDSADNRIWPAADERQGAIPHHETSIDVTKSGDGDTPTFTIRMTTFVDGSFDESTFALLNDVRVYSTQSTVTTEYLAQQVATDLSAAGHGWDNSQEDIESITKVLEPMFFEYQSYREAMVWACGFGNVSGNRIAWGIRMDDRGRFFLETMDLDAVDYLVRRGNLPMEASVGGTVQESYQGLRGRYRDILGEQQVTDWQWSPTSAYFGDRYRRGSVDLEGVDNETDADALVAVRLEEIQNPQKRSRYRVMDGAIFTPWGAPVPFDEVKATGRLMRIEDWRSVEAGRSSSDLRNSWTTEQIVGVQVDYESRSVELIPGSAKSTFERMLAELARINLR
jgi:hypothetical protein